MPVSPLDGDALIAARDAVYWELLLPACERVSGGRPPEDDPGALESLVAAARLQQRVGYPGRPLRGVRLTGNENTVVWRAALSWVAGARETARDGRRFPDPDGATSAPRAAADLHRFQVLSAHLAELAG